MENQRAEHEETEATSEGVTEPSMGKGLPSYRPWDWIAGFGLAAVIIAIMFGFAESTYHM
ncbi:MAG: hypothetical protein MJA84_05805 [Firmicutes bacterium]|nr:hypothetical protein [Bacillota bacterium]